MKKSIRLMTRRVAEDRIECKNVLAGLSCEQCQLDQSKSSFSEMNGDMKIAEH